MKKFLCKVSIIIPLLFIYVFLIDNITLSITEIGLYLDRFTVQALFIGLTTIWLCCSPFRRSCCNGSLTEVFFYLVPVEAISILVFAQYHFKIVLLMIFCLSVIELKLLLFLQKDAQKRGRTERRRRRYKNLFFRATMWVTTAVCIIPCLIAQFQYNLHSPSYTYDEDIWNILLAEEDSAKAASLENPYEKHMDLLQCFEQDTWNTYQIEEKITLVQGIINFEAEKFDIPAITATAEKLSAFTLGEYSSETGEIWIDVELLGTATAKEVLETVSHEFYHHLQFFLTSNVDWENPAMNSLYFSELKSWKENQEDYKVAWVNGFRAYENQPLEASARAYAEEETERILSYIQSEP